MEDTRATLRRPSASPSPSLFCFRRHMRPMLANLRQIGLCVARWYFPTREQSVFDREITQSAKDAKICLGCFQAVHASGAYAGAESHCSVSFQFPSSCFGMSNVLGLLLSPRRFLTIVCGFRSIKTPRTITRRLSSISPRKTTKEYVYSVRS